jgi:hypothetical protein
MRATEALVEAGTVPPRVVRVSVASSIVCFAGDSVGVAQCVGFSCHVSTTQYCLMPAIYIVGTNNVIMPG